MHMLARARACTHTHTHTHPPLCLKFSQSFPLHLGWWQNSLTSSTRPCVSGFHLAVSERKANFTGVRIGKILLYKRLQLNQLGLAQNFLKIIRDSDSALLSLIYDCYLLVQEGRLSTGNCNQNLLQDGLFSNTWKWTEETYVPTKQETLLGTGSWGRE